MPIQQHETDHSAPSDGDGAPAWMGMQLPAASHWQAFHHAFLALYRNRPDQDLLAVFTALENRRIVVLPPEAARLVQRELPRYKLRPCARPPSNMIALELGHILQRDTGWFDLPAEERQRRRDLHAGSARAEGAPPAPGDRQMTIGGQPAA